MCFGINLRKYRKVKGLSQSMLSELTNIPRITLINLETEKTFPDLKQVKTLCNALNVSVMQLLDESS